MSKYIIFNSLGSNYDWQFLWLNFRQLIWPVDARAQLKKHLANEFEANQVILTRQGRDAIQLALEAAGVGKGDVVLTQGLACYAIEEAILRTGATPAYVDVGPNLNLNLKNLKKVARQNQRVKAVIVQYLLGMPTDTQVIQTWAKQQKIALIEDLAQSLGTITDNKPAGSWGDLVVLSFGRDKMVDAVAGGAVLSRTTYDLPAGISLTEATLKEKIYPFISASTRWGYRLGWGRVVFKVAKKFNWIWSPIDSVGEVAGRMPAHFSSLVLYQFKRLSSQVKHRRLIGQVYDSELKSSTKLTKVLNKLDLKLASLQRYPILVDSELLLPLISFLKGRGIFISDRWYRSAVDCGSENCSTVYTKGSAPMAEEYATQILNLPTHQHINQAKAKYIAQQINTFLEKKHGTTRI